VTNELYIDAAVVSHFAITEVVFASQPELQIP